MTWDEILPAWCAVWGAFALVGFGMSLAGVTKAQRTVRLAGRIDRVREPRHGESRGGGISVVVVYRDPATGQDVTITNDEDRGDMITAAWEGREVGVGYPRGRPHAYRFTNFPEKPSRGLGWPFFGLFLVYAGLVVWAAIDWAWPWALVGSAGPWALFGIAYLPGAVATAKTRVARLAAMETVPGRVIAVLRDISIDQDDGRTYTTHTPVLSFTTADGKAVLTHCTDHLPNPGGAKGREVTVHYSAADPVFFTLDREASRRSESREVVYTVVAIGVLAATAVVGAVLLAKGTA